MSIFNRNRGASDNAVSYLLRERNLSATFENEKRELAANLNEFVKDIRINFANLQYNMQQNVEMSEDISNHIISSKRTFDSIQSRIHELALTLNDGMNDLNQFQTVFSKFIDTNSESRNITEQVGQTLSRVKHAVDEGISEYRTVIESVEMSSEYYKLIADNMRDLSEQMHAMNAIIQEVKNISTQTNLLALNASIEAARAGEYGKGFTVVAQEIGKLAHQSELAARRVEDTLNGISENAAGLSEEISNKVSSILSGVEKAKATEDSMNEISGNTREMQDNVSKLVQNVKIQADIEKRTASLSENMISLINTISSIGENIESSSKQYLRDSDEIVLLLKNNEVKVKDIFHAINSYTESLKLDSEMQTKITSAVKMLEGISDKPSLLERSKNSASRKSLKMLVQANPHIDVVCALNHEGWSTVSNIDEEDFLLNFKNRPYFKESMAGKNYVSKPYLSTDTYNYTAAVSVPIRRGSEIIGVIMADVSLM